MSSSVRAAWLRVAASYWFIPSLLTIAALLLALTTIQLDRTWGAEWLNDRGNQWSLGVFIATFVYNLACLGSSETRRTRLGPKSRHGGAERLRAAAFQC
jgi:uncharacterized membrane protein